MTDAEERLEPGTVLDLHRRYRIEAFLGAGGFAQVYRAKEMGIDRSVALKLLDVGPRVATTHKQRFFREAQAAARIGHPDVVTVYEHGVAPDGRPYIAQEFLDGRDLAEELAVNGPMSPRRAVPLFVDVLDALAAAHEVGVAHRDLKPPNLFLDRVGTRRERLVLLDFGVACFYEQLDDRLTATGGFLGTPRYMAPEYIERREVGPAIDVYQMGLVLVESMSGQSAVLADNAYQSMVAHVRGLLQIPGWLDAGPIGPVVRAALARDPADRPTAAELRDRLDGLPDYALDRDAALSASDPGSLGSAPTGDVGPPATADGLGRQRSASSASALASAASAASLIEASMGPGAGRLRVVDATTSSPPPMSAEEATPLSLSVIDDQPTPISVPSLHDEDEDDAPTPISMPAALDPYEGPTPISVPIGPPKPPNGAPPPVPYSARRAPETEALTLSAFVEPADTPVGDLPPLPLTADAAATTLAVAPPRKRRLPLLVLVAVFVGGLAAALAGLQWADTAAVAARDAGVDSAVPDAAAMPDAAVPDAAANDSAVDAARDATVPDARRPGPTRAAPRPARRPPKPTPPTAVTPPPTRLPPATSSDGSAGPTAGDLLRWRSGVTPPTKDDRL